MKLLYGYANVPHREKQAVIIENALEKAGFDVQKKDVVFLRYAWRGSLTPVVTILGIDLGTLFGGGIVTEYTFGLAGIGRLAVQSVQNKDLPLTMG